MSCPNCSQCSADQPLSASESEGQMLAGWQLVLASAGFFLLPIVMAIVGCSLVTVWGPAIQLVGAIAGLGLGLACVKVARCVLARTQKNNSTPTALYLPPCDSGSPCHSGTDEPSLTHAT